MITLLFLTFQSINLGTFKFRFTENPEWHQSEPLRLPQALFSQGDSWRR